MWDSILVFIKYLIVIVGYFFEKKTEKKKLKKEALDEVKAGIKNHDAARITSGFDKLRRV